MIVFAAIVPHPPASVRGIGNDEQLQKLEKTLEAFKELRFGLEMSLPETIVVITPHGRMEEYSFVINKSEILFGDLSRFGENTEYHYRNDLGLVNSIIYDCMTNELPLHSHYDRLDHGTLIPLHHLLENISPRVVHISFSLLDFNKHYEFGRLLSKSLDETDRRIAVLASADLSHRVTPESPVGYSSSAKFFDSKVIEIIECRDVHRLMQLKVSVIKEAAECGLRSIIILLSILNGRKYETNVISYEHPFGIGHLVARLL